MFIFVITALFACPRSSCPVGSAPPGTPCGRARPAPASVGVAALAWSAEGVEHHMASIAYFAIRNTKSVSFFIRCDSRRSTAGGCFPPPLRASLQARRSSFGRAPRHSQKSPSPPFEAAQGLCISRNFTEEILADGRLARTIRLRNRKMGDFVGTKRHPA